MKACEDARFSGALAHDLIANGLNEIFPDLLAAHRWAMKEPLLVMCDDVAGTPGAADRVRSKVALVKRSVASERERLCELYPQPGGPTSSSSVAVTLGLDPPVPEGSSILTVPHPTAGVLASSGKSSGTPPGVVRPANLLPDDVVYFRPHNVRL